jgi:hypothetical protein
MPARRSASPIDASAAQDAPANASTTTTTETVPGTALALPADVRADLLRSQVEEIGTNQPLPQVGVMPAGAGLFEFEDTHETTRDFEGVILGSHARNVLWDKAFGQNTVRADGKKEGPACQSRNGKQGIPREGFAHAALQRAGTATVAATGMEVIDCATCPYNQWGSVGTVRGRPGTKQDGTPGKGKDVTNQRSVYVMLAGRFAPVEVTLPPTSLKAYDEYVSTLSNQGIPVQAVVTKFTQSVVQMGQFRVGVVGFARGATLDNATFGQVLEMRQRFSSQIIPGEVLVEASYEPEEPAGTIGGAEITGSDDIPF